MVYAATGLKEESLGKKLLEKFEAKEIYEMSFVKIEKEVKKILESIVFQVGDILGLNDPSLAEPDGFTRAKVMKVDNRNITIAPMSQDLTKIAPKKDWQKVSISRC